MPISNQSASAIVSSMLEEYGLSYDAATVNRWVGLLSDNPNNDILIEEEIRQSQQFQERFSGMQRRIENGYDPISVDEYLDLESGYQATMRAMGMPETFYDDPSDYEELIVNDVSVTELEKRVASGYVAAQQAPQEVRDALSNFYNIPDSDAALAAYYLDPERALPAIERQFEAAQVAGQAELTTFGELSQEDAERLAGLGVDSATAGAGFSKLARERELLGSLLGQDEAFSQDEMLAGTFENNAEVQEKMRRRREQRTGAFGGTAGGGVGRSGVAGLGGSDSTS